MIFLGITLGLLYEIMMHHGTYKDMSNLTKLFLLNIFMIPSLDNHANIIWFPLNIAFWSLFFEFIAYFLHAIAYIRSGKWPLVFTILVAIPGVMGWVYNTFDRQPSILTGPYFESEIIQCTSRLLFAYFSGVWMYRYRERLSFIPSLNFYTLASICIIIFSMPKHALPPEINSLIMIFVYPFIVFSASSCIIEGKTKAIGVFIGSLSYPLYAIHIPIMWTLYVLLKRFMPNVMAVLWGGFIIPVLLLLAWLSLKFYDEPIRAYLAQKWVQKPHRIRVPDEVSPV